MRARKGAARTANVAASAIGASAIGASAIGASESPDETGTADVRQKAVASEDANDRDILDGRNVAETATIPVVAENDRDILDGRNVAETATIPVVAEIVPGVTFEQLGLVPELLEAVEAAGYQHPTPIQRDAIPLVLKGRDVMGLAQTGTGKTAAFTLPIIQRLSGGPRRMRCLILTPTRELCVQVEESFRKYGRFSTVECAPIYGGVAYDAQEKALRRGVDVIVATPGRFIDHMEKDNVSLNEMEILVLDEADRMLDMGFAPQINRIVSGVSPYRQTLLFSATMPPEVEALARKYLRRPIVVQVGRRSSAASAVRHAVYPVPRPRKNALLVELLRKPEMDSVLVFTRTKHGADRVVRDLHQAGVEATAMHADKTQAQRTKALEAFKQGDIRVLVATDIAQRGLDISGISHVINYDVPGQAEDYIHRIGRTGRASASGDAFTFMAPDEIAMVRTIERVLGQPIDRISIPGFDFGTVAAVD